MNFPDLTVSAAPVGTAPSFPVSGNHGRPPSALERLVAGLHRRAAAPRGYRFVANIAVEDFARAVHAVKQVAIVSEVRLITPAVDDAGNMVSDIALYVRDDLPAPEAFWAVFYSLDEYHAA